MVQEAKELPWSEAMWVFMMLPLLSLPTSLPREPTTVADQLPSEWLERSEHSAWSMVHAQQMLNTLLYSHDLYTGPSPPSSCP